MQPLLHFGLLSVVAGSHPHHRQHQEYEITPDAESTLMRTETKRRRGVHRDSGKAEVDQLAHAINGSAPASLNVSVPSPSPKVVYVPVPVPVPMPSQVIVIDKIPPHPVPSPAPQSRHWGHWMHQIARNAHAAFSSVVNESDPGLQAARALLDTAQKKLEAVIPMGMNVTGISDATGGSTYEEVQTTNGTKVYSQSLQREVFVQKGEQGAMGPRGQLGPAGDSGEPGLDGLQGPRGYHGPRGTDGKDGEVLVMVEPDMPVQLLKTSMLGPIVAFNVGLASLVFIGVSVMLDRSRKK